MSVMYPETTEDLVNVSDLEELWDKTPPLCEMTVVSRPCGNPAVWRLYLHCTTCDRTNNALVCQVCHDRWEHPLSGQPRCKHCLTVSIAEWKPL